jgi:hypothetical protein
MAARAWFRAFSFFDRSLWLHTMKRCVRTALVATVVAAASAMTIAQQLPRNFPATALRGELLIVSPPDATIDGRDARLAPGARIRGANNMLVLSGTVLGQRLTVNYTVDGFGLVKDVWVLRPEEAAKPWPRSTEEAQEMVFDPLTQTWSQRR